MSTAERILGPLIDDYEGNSSNSATSSGIAEGSATHALSLLPDTVESSTSVDQAKPAPSTALFKTKLSHVAPTPAPNPSPSTERPGEASMRNNKSFLNRWPEPMLKECSAYPNPDKYHVNAMPSATDVAEQIKWLRARKMECEEMGKRTTQRLKEYGIKNVDDLRMVCMATECFSAAKVCKYLFVHILWSNKR